MIEDAQLNEKEVRERGRLRKRTRHEANDSDVSMDEGQPTKKPTRTLTPAQRHISAQKRTRTLTAERREGSVPKRLPYKPVPESHVRAAQKIEKKVFKHSIYASASDHAI